MKEILKDATANILIVDGTHKVNGLLAKYLEIFSQWQFFLAQNSNQRPSVYYCDSS
jgi:hypothetical protein